MPCRLSLQLPNSAPMHSILFVEWWPQNRSLTVLLPTSEALYIGTCNQSGRYCSWQLPVGTEYPVALPSSQNLSFFLQVLCHSQAGHVSMAGLPGTAAQQEASAAAARGCACIFRAQAGLGGMEAMLHALGQAEKCRSLPGCIPLAFQCSDWKPECLGRGLAPLEHPALFGPEHTQCGGSSDCHCSGCQHRCTCTGLKCSLPATRLTCCTVLFHSCSIRDNALLGWTYVCCLPLLSETVHAQGDSCTVIHNDGAGLL